MNNYTLCLFFHSEFFLVQFTKLYLRDLIQKNMEVTEANTHMCIGQVNLAVY